MRVKNESAIIINDKPETRDYKEYDSVIPFSMSEICAMRTAAEKGSF
jgi:hypothetical protein